jgi:hypothetical protein
MKYRHRVSGLLILLFAITYIDRVCISVAGPRMQEDLHIDPVGWGWVTAMEGSRSNSRGFSGCAWISGGSTRDRWSG